MSELISRKAVIDAISTWDKFGVDERSRIVRWREGLVPYVKLEDVITAISNTPPTQSEPKRGKWLDANICGELPVIVCNQCNTFYPLSFGEFHNFCPNCGADMRGEQNECNN